MNKILTPLFKIFTLFLLLFVVAHPLFSQHVMVYDSIDHKEYHLKWNYKVIIKKTSNTKLIECKISRFDDSCLYVIKGNKKGWVRYDDIEYLAFKPDQKTAFGVWLVSSVISASIAIPIISNVANAEGVGYIERKEIIAFTYAIAFMAPILVSQIYKSSLHQKTFVIGKGSSIQYFPK